MLVSKRKYWLIKYFNSYLWKNIITMILFFSSPLLIFFIFYLSSDGDYNLAWIKLTESNSEYRDRTGEPILYFGNRILGGGYYFGFIVFCLVIIFSACYLIRSLIVNSLYSMLGRYQANKIVNLAPMKLEDSTTGMIRLQGERGSTRNGYQPYVEVSLGGTYLAGLMGNEGVNVTLPEGSYILTLELVYLDDWEEAYKLNKSIKDPLTLPIEESRRRQCSNYSTELPVEIVCGIKKAYKFRTFYYRRKVKEENFSPVSCSGLRGLFEKIIICRT